MRVFCSQPQSFFPFHIALSAVSRAGSIPTPRRSAACPPTGRPAHCRCCSQLGKFRKLSQKNIVSLVQSNYELGTHSPAPWIQVFKQRLSLWCQLAQSPLLSLVPPDVLDNGAQDIADVYVSEQPFTTDSRPSLVGASACFLSCAFWICLHVAGVCLK